MANELVVSKAKSADIIGLDGTALVAVDTKDPAWKSTVMRAKNETTDQGLDCLNQEIALSGVMMHRAGKVNGDTGELKEWVRTVLFLEGGRTVSFGSEGIFQSVRDLATLFGDPPWKPAIKVRVKARPLDNGRHWYYLEPI